MLRSFLRNTLTQALSRSVKTGLAVPLFSLLAVSASFAQYPPLPAVQATATSPNFKEGKVVLEERRIRAFTYLGGEENIIRQTLRRIVTQGGDAPGGWVYEWSALGKYYEDRGDALVKAGPQRSALDPYVTSSVYKAGRRHAALDAYMTSSVYYALAWFPRVNSEEEGRAYDAQLRVYQKGGQLFDVPLEVVKVPFRGGYITTYLHKPLGVEKPPLVIWCGGVDQYKANHYRPIQDMLAKGFAVATLDQPGFGESRQWAQEASPDANFATLEAYLKRGDIDTTRISFFGQSYGAGTVLRVALRNDPRVKAYVAMCGGLHLGGKNSLAPEAKPGDQLINGPMLVVNGTRDPGSPVVDLMSTYQAAKVGDLWLLGLGEHCAVEYWPVVIPQMADWLNEKVNR
jgi:dienelactone hydrolase